MLGDTETPDPTARTDAAEPTELCSAPPHAGSCPPPRRSFLIQLLAAAVSAVAGVVPLVTGLFVAFDPLRRRQSAGPPFVPVARLDSVPPDGRPRLFRVIADRQDAWNLLRSIPVGAVYLRRAPEKPDEVIAFNTVCPHLGCFVNSKDDGTYHCPCHDSVFRADGERATEASPSPRGLDRLAVRVEEAVILVQFMNFKTTVKERIPIG